MKELQEHEVLAETKNGDHIVVSAQYYNQNKSVFKKMIDGGLKNKMDTPDDGTENKTETKAKK